MWFSNKFSPIDTMLKYTVNLNTVDLKAYPEIVPLSSLIACNAVNWPGGDALSFSYRFHHWLIPLADLRGGARDARPPPGGPNSFIFMQFSANIWKIIALLGVGAPPWGKSWIRHWILYTLGQYIVNVQSSTTSDGFSTIFIFGIWVDNSKPFGRLWGSIQISSKSKA